MMRKILISVLLCAFPLAAHATAAFVQQSENSSATGVSSLAAPAITVTAGDLLVIVVSSPHPSDQYSGNITFTGVTPTFACAAGVNAGSTTFTAAPTGSGATLSSAWSDDTGKYVINFSDNETRYATFTNGSTAVTWSNALTGTPTATISTGNSDTGEIAYYVQNAAGGSTTVTASDTSPAIQGVYVAEYSGIATSGAFLGCSGGLIVSPGTGANAVTTDTATAGSTPALIFGFTQAEGSASTTGASAGTGFTARTYVFGTWAQPGFPEDNTAPSGTPIVATWNGTGAQFSAFMSVALAFSGASGSSCTHDGITSAGALAVPNGTSGSYQGKTGAFVTPDCSTVNYKQPTVGNFGVN